MELSPLLADARLAVVEELEDLTDEQWAAPSLCAGWSAHLVAAHLNSAWAISPLAIGRAVLQARGSIDGAVDRMTRAMAARLSPAECLAGLRANAANDRAAPGLSARAPLTDVVCHAGDILQPLGRTMQFDPAVLACVFGFLLGDDSSLLEARTRARAFLPPSRVAGLSFATTDTDQRFGSGPAEVSGPSLAVVGAILRRAAWFDQLSGPGVELLTARG